MNRIQGVINVMCAFGGLCIGIACLMLLLFVTENRSKIEAIECSIQRIEASLNLSSAEDD